MTKYIAMTDHDALCLRETKQRCQNHTKASASWRWADVLSSGDYFESLETRTDGGRKTLHSVLMAPAGEQRQGRPSF
jgi:hypothetical protein